VLYAAGFCCTVLYREYLWHLVLWSWRVCTSWAADEQVFHVCYSVLTSQHLITCENCHSTTANPVMFAWPLFCSFCMMKQKIEWCRYWILLVIHCWHWRHLNDSKIHHSLNGSSSPLTMATPHSCTSLCDFLTFLPAWSLWLDPQTNLHTRWLKQRGFTQGCDFCSKNCYSFILPDLQYPDTVIIWQIYV